LTLAVGLWSTLINVMRIFHATETAISIPAIRISGHNVRAGIGA